MKGFTRVNAERLLPLKSNPKQRDLSFYVQLLRNESGSHFFDTIDIENLGYSLRKAELIEIQKNEASRFLLGKHETKWEIGTKPHINHDLIDWGPVCSQQKWLNVIQMFRQIVDIH